MRKAHFEQRELDERNRTANALLSDAPRVIDLIERGAHLNPDGDALVFLRTAEDRQPVGLSYRQLVATIAGTCVRLRELGVGPQDVVSIMAPPSPATFVAIWSAMGCAVAHPLNLLFSRDALVSQLTAARTKILVVPPKGEPGGLYEKAEGLIDEVPSLQRIVSVPLDGSISFDGVEIEPDLNWSGTLRALKKEKAPDQVTALFPTGGTTGHPKIACLTDRSMAASAIGSLLAVDYGPEDRVFVALPLFHVGGAFVLTLASLAGGAAVYIPTILGARDPAVVKNFWGIVDHFRITVASLVPTTLAAIAVSPRDGPSTASLRFVGTGAAPCPPETARQVLAAWGGDAVRQVYGMTEFSGAIAQVPHNKLPADGSVGLPVALAEVAILTNEAALDRSAREIGELVVRGPQVFSGYLDVGHNDGTFHEGWLRTGDLCKIDDAGQIHILGRIKDLIIRGGHNIDPLMIEDAAMEYPGISTAAAVGRPDSYAGEVPMLFVTPAEGRLIDVDDLRAFLEKRISERPALPKSIEVLEQMPLTLVGKIFKPRLRELAAEVEVNSLVRQAVPDANIAVKALIDPARGVVVQVASTKLDQAARNAELKVLAGLPLHCEEVDPD